MGKPRMLKLDRMEILGFKSFYGRTRFEFPDGITAVVGPNGCGKSNIGDAISWVLGEQKASSLRSDRMEDVIFNGSEGRRPLGMAEVSLHFRNILAAGNGNGDRVLPIAVAAESVVPGSDAPESSPQHFTAIEDVPEQVVVTRRIYRSGESEYILNGERCRLKDIQDLLSRTDIGSRLYSTIEQGKIDQVLAAKPKDRRAMFEEAAGILGYRSKRRQAELKLEAAQANLLRINDIVVEVEKQINTLRRQAAKARRYQRLTDDLRDRRALLLRHRLLSCEESRLTTDEAIESLRVEEAAVAAAFSADEAECERLRLRLEEGENAARARREEIHALDLEIDRFQERLRAGQELTRDLESRLAEGGAELDALRERLVEQDGHLSAAIRDLALVEDLLRSAASSVADPAGESERALTIESLETGLETTRAALVETIEAVSGMTRRRASLEEQTRLAQAALRKIADETAGLAAAREGLAADDEMMRREAEAGRERARAAEAESAQASEAERVAADRLADAEKRAEELKGRAAVLAERSCALEEMERQHAGFSEGVGEILKGSAGVASRGVVGDRLAVPPGLEKAVEATLGDLLEAVVVGGAEEALRGVSYLRGSARGRVSFVTETDDAERERDRADAPGSSGPEVPVPGAARLSERIGGAPAGPVGRILERTVLVGDFDEAFRLHASQPAFAYVTPQGDIVRIDGSATGGDGRALQHWLLQRRAEREEIARRLSESETARAEAERTFPGLRQELAAARDRRTAAVSAVQSEARLAFEHDLKLQQGRAEMDRIDRARPLLEGERVRLERDVAAWDEEMRSLAMEVADAEKRRRAAEEDIQGRGAELPALRAELDRLRRESAEERAVLAAAEQRRASLERERDHLLETIEDLRATIARRARERDDWTARIAAARELGESLEPQSREAQERRAEAAARDEAAHAGLAYERGLLNAREQAIKETRALQAALRERQQQHELQRARLEADLEHLERACRDEAGLTLEGLRALPAPPSGGPGLGEREAEVQAIRADLEAIGPVNLMAVEQQQDLEERFTFLTTQKDDLERAITSLRETIRTINREARERFREAFQAIEGHFKECFKTLFGGGQAELRLSDGEEDVLEAGIEIAAQPPGKRLQKIGLLSGGEKALTAVALLVSLFRYRPSPFCILDEVDAPLDEANVERFTRLLQELRTDTQFILITHNRKSMEAADLLYGVTMEEPGVSKILPLRFE